MNGKINEQGFLQIERAGEMENQFCPYETHRQCGDWCPQFGEPVNPYAKQVTFLICGNRFLHFDQFEDDRLDEIELMEDDPADF